VSALTDTRPFPYHYLRWWRLPSAWRALGDRLYSLALSGEVMLLLVLATAVSLSALILLVPAALARVAGNGRPKSRPADRPFPIVFFLAIGAGYMLFELGWLAALGLLLENPSLAFAAGAGGLLLASGAGGIVGARTQRLLLSLAAAAAAGIGLAGALAVATQWLLPLPPWPRAAAAAAALLPCGFVLGMPFPLGLRRREAAPGRGGLAYAWAANGASSVVASVLAPFVSMTWGTPMLFACAGACYAVALAAADSARTRAPSPGEQTPAPAGGLPSTRDTP
jgi:hypothetical protein